MTTHYEVLGVRPEADAAEVRRAYVALARLHHPDRAGGDADRMRAINEAWATLGDPLRRLQYDQIRTRHATQADRARRSGVPDPNYDPDDDIDVEERDDDWGDDTPYAPTRTTVALPGWLAVLPVGLFAASIGLFFLGVVFAAPAIVAAAFMAFLLSVLLFLASPFLALMASRSVHRTELDEDQRR